MSTPWLACVAIAAVLLYGCVDTAGVARSAPGESRVFGDVDAIKNGTPVKNMQGMDFAGASIVLLKIGKPEGDLINLPGDGFFSWSLQPGEYMLLAFQYATDGARRSLNLRGRFVVPSQPVSMYIGSLVVTYDKGAHAAGLRDDFDGATAILRQKQPGAPANVVKNLLESEERLGSYAAVVNACDSRWAIKCGDSQYGVRPISPPHSSSSFTEVSSSSPTFRWSASERGDVRYDLVIYESISCRSIVLLTDRLPGCVFLYREGLSVNEFTPEQPLGWDRKYLWSVRFRDGDTVSDWSSTGHFAFFLIGYSAASGEWFAFKTPAGQ